MKKKKKEGISLFTMDCTMQSTVKGIKRKKNKKIKIKASAFSPWTAYNIKR
jgi:hypothetical protein